VVCIVVIAIRAQGFCGASVMGSVYVAMSDHEYSNADTRWLTGYWLACVVGPLLLALGLLRDKIIGRRQSMA
jgi:hypothetical protein